MNVPRFRIAWVMVFVALAALNFAVFRAAINDYRISDWVGGVPRAATRTSPFVRLVA
jgi:hypothetical protein